MCEFIYNIHVNSYYNNMFFLLFIFFRDFILKVQLVLVMSLKLYECSFFPFDVKYKTDVNSVLWWENAVMQYDLCRKHQQPTNHE